MYNAISVKHNKTKALLCLTDTSLYIYICVKTSEWQTLNLAGLEVSK